MPEQRAKCSKMSAVLQKVPGMHFPSHVCYVQALVTVQNVGEYLCCFRKNNSYTMQQ